MSITVNVNVNAGTAPIYITAGLTNTPTTVQDGRADGQTHDAVHATPIHEGPTTQTACNESSSHGNKSGENGPIPGPVAEAKVTPLPWDSSRGFPLFYS